MFNAFVSFQSASCYQIEEDEDLVAEGRKPVVHGGTGGALGNVGGLSSNGTTLRAPPAPHVASARAMTFPRHQHNVLPAVVTEGERIMSPYRPQVPLVLMFKATRMAQTFIYIKFK